MKQFAQIFLAVLAAILVAAAIIWSIKLHDDKVKEDAALDRELEKWHQKAEWAREMSRLYQMTPSPRPNQETRKP